MSIGERIKQLRKEQGYTQEQLAELLNISFQAISSWERDENLPETAKLIALSKVLKTSIDKIVFDKSRFDSKPVEKIFNIDHMKTFIKATSKAKNYPNTLKALDFAFEAHQGQYRKNSDIPYIYHPLNLACHALSLGIDDDTIIAACLLHDTIEDCNKKEEDLPVDEETKKLVCLLSHTKDDSNRKAIMDNYYQKIAENPKASLIKLLDRYNNITTMSWGLSKERMIRQINETESYILPLIKVIKQIPEYNNAAYLLNYNIRSIVDVYKRFI